MPPSQGGKYSGFGYNANPPTRSQSEYGFESWGSLSSVSIKLLIKIFNRNYAYTSLIQQSITSFATVASKIAAKATENATKIGSIATQKVSELTESVNEKVIKFKFKLFRFSNLP